MCLYLAVEDTAIHVFSNFNSTPEGVYLSVFLKSGNQYYHYNSDKSPAIQSLLKKFATGAAFDAVSKRLDRESKELRQVGTGERGIWLRIRKPTRRKLNAPKKPSKNAKRTWLRMQTLQRKKQSCHH